VLNVRKYRVAMRARAMTELRQAEAELRLSFMQDLLPGELGRK
jgi:hypothetical protein